LAEFVRLSLYCKWTFQPKYYPTCVTTRKDFEWHDNLQRELFKTQERERHRTNFGDDTIHTISFWKHFNFLQNNPWRTSYDNLKAKLEKLFLFISSNLHILINRDIISFHNSSSEVAVSLQSHQIIIMILLSLIQSALHYIYTHKCNFIPLETSQLKNIRTIEPHTQSYQTHTSLLTTSIP